MAARQLGEHFAFISSLMTAKTSWTRSIR